MKRNSVGIVTFTYGTNYGCKLQRYALQTILQGFDLNVESLIFKPSVKNTLTRQRLTRLFTLNTFCSILVRRLSVMQSFVFDKLFEKRQRERRLKIFEKFERKFLINSERLNSYDDVQKKGIYYDVLVAGSDQIWNLAYSGDMFFKYYMLDFVPGEKKISYAPSIGISQIPQVCMSKYKRYLSDFSWISVRENEGAKELERILNRSVDVVLDPTMLLSLEEWGVVTDQFPTNKIQAVPYILCYSLGNQEAVVRKAFQIQNLYKLPVLYLCTTIREYMSLRVKHSCVKPILNTGPGEFVSLIKDSAYVVTDSFHGSVFSILYRKPFFTMMRDKANPTKSMNSRMSTLFSTFHLESRLFSPNDKSPLTPESIEIDYEAVDKILQERREYSINKLREAIENVVERNVEA